MKDYRLYHDTVHNGNASTTCDELVVVAETHGLTVAINWGNKGWDNIAMEGPVEIARYRGSFRIPTREEVAMILFEAKE